jgi:ParB-like chromosome segregation protein Spo0J
MTQWIEIGKLTPSEINPRQIQEHKFERLKRSLSSADGKKFFEVRPCLVNKRDGKLVIYAGNMRYRAAKALGWPQVPCVIEELPLAVEKERTIKDNVSQGDWDMDGLANHYEVTDLREWGFSPEEVAFSDTVVEPVEEEKPKRGGRPSECPNCGYKL